MLNISVENFYDNFGPILGGTTSCGNYTRVVPQISYKTASFG